MLERASGLPRVLIVEDELLIADRVGRYLRTSPLLPPLEIFGPAPSLERARALASATTPDLALVDIRLRGEGTGIDFALWLRDTAPEASIIFLTSQDGDRYLREARAVRPEGYLIKPLQPRSLCAMAALALGKPTGPTLRLPTGSGVATYDLRTLTYIRQDHVYAVYYFADGSSVMVRESLTEAADRLGGGDFVRVHRSFVVNVRHITSRTARRVVVAGVEIPVGRSRREALREALA